MPQLHFVKKARKDYPPDIKKGDSYYHWAFMQGGRGGPKIRSKTKPSRSQLTSSPFKSELYAIQDGADTVPGFDDLESDRDSIRDALDSLKSDTEGSLEAMPDGLKEGDTGQTLQTRIDSLEEAISALESVDFDFDAGEKTDDETDEEFKTRWVEEKWTEVTEALSNIDEG